MSADSRPFRVFLASFLVLFLEVALIRWMPAHVRLLSYFSNFILLSPFWWFGVAFAAVFVIANLDQRTPRQQRLAAFYFVGLLTFSLGLVHQLSGGAIWSPYYKITVQHRDNDETVVEVNNIFHQSI